MALPHTIPVNDHLLLLFGQLEKQSGRSIAHISGEKEKKLCVVVLLWTEILLHHTQNLGVVIKKIKKQKYSVVSRSSD